MKLFFLLASLIFTKELEVEVDDKKIIDPTKTNDDNCFEDKINTFQICNKSSTETEQSISNDNCLEDKRNTLKICNNSLTTKTTKSEQSISTKTNDDKTFYTSKDYINSSNEIIHDELFFTFFTFFMFLF